MLGHSKCHKLEFVSCGQQIPGNCKPKYGDLKMARLYRSWVSISPFVVVVFLLGGCGNDTSEPETTHDIPLPPSVQSADAPSFQVVTLNEQQAAELKIKTVPVMALDEHFPLQIPGTVYPAPDHIALVSSPITGRVAHIYAHEGEAVRLGQALLELESLEFAALAADYLKAKADEAYASQQVERQQLLVDKKISPRSQLEKAQADQLRANAAVQAVYAQLKTVGVPDAQLEAWLQGESAHPRLTIRAPITGIISEHLIDLGQSVTAYDKMLSLINLTRVYVKGFVSPDDALLVQAGDSVRIKIPSMPNAFLPATVATINPELDEVSKSVTVNILVSTRNGWPLPGQNVQLDVLVKPREPVLTIPLLAIQYEDDQAMVYVRTSPRTFEKRPISIARINNSNVMVNSGIALGEDIAVTQVFSLKALGRYSQYAEE
jgi:cobalt-zinc-cadmium efflux system membrane fusion protein